MTASAWSPNSATITQANAAGLIKMEQVIMTLAQQIVNISTFAYTVGSGSLAVYRNGLALARNADFVEIGTAGGSSTQFILSNASNAGDTILVMGFVGITGSVTVDPVLRADLIAGSGSNIVSFLQQGIGGVIRSMQEKGRETLAVTDYMSAAIKADMKLAVPLLDHTAAWQTAINAIAALSITTVEASGYTTIREPILVTPYGRSNVTQLTIPSSLTIRGEGTILNGTNATLDVLVGTTTRWMDIEGLVVVGGKSAFNVGNANLDATRYKLWNCEFHSQADYSLRSTVTGSANTHLSCTWLVEQCKFMNPRKICRNICDYMIFKNCDFYVGKINFDANSSAFRNAVCDGNPRTYFYDCTGVPTMGTYGVDRLVGVSWFSQLQGDFFSYNSRWGGEFGGMPIIYYAAPMITNYPYLGPQIFIEGGECFGGPSASPDSGLIYLSGTSVPHTIGINNCKGPIDIPLISNAGGTVNFATVYTNWETASGKKSPYYMKYEFKNMAVQGEDAVALRIPKEMNRYVGVRMQTMSNSALQAVPQTTITAMILNTTVHDSLASMVVATDNTKFNMVNAANRVRVTCTTQIAAAVAKGIISLRLYNSSGVNLGGKTLRIDDAAGSGADTMEHGFTINLYSVVPGEWYQVKAYCSSVGGFSTVAGTFSVTIEQLDTVD